MKKIIFLFIAVMLFGLVGCGSNEQGSNEKTEKEKEEIIKAIDKIKLEYEIFEGETIDLLNEVGDFSFSSDSSIIELKDGNKATGLSFGEAKIKVSDGTSEKEITLTVKEVKDFSCEDMYIYVGEKKKLDIKLKGYTLSDINAIANDDSVLVEMKDNYFEITGNKPGETRIILTSGSETKEVTIQVNEVEIRVLNESLNVDVFETLELQLDYPESMIKKEDITYTISREGYFTIDNNVVYPIKEGKSRVKIQAGDIKKTIEINVTVDPVKIIQMLHQEEAIMKKAIKLYGGTVEEQPLMGSVSRYMFDDLNLVEDIIPIYDNPYIGEVATREIVDYLDKKKNTSVAGAPRTGVKMTSILYITYHDTANVNAGADARANANWMVNQYSVTTTARSWHYTVDAKQVIHSVPDNEITFQGDTYEAYTTSIGIETCVNKGTNLDKVWHRMGKLCAKLMVKYDIDVNHIKQHYDWMGKECPHTLRANGLYPYAISLVEGELIVKKYLNDYTLTFESLSPEYLDNTGQIIKAPSEEINVSYKVTITNESGYNESITLTTKVKPLS